MWDPDSGLRGMVTDSGNGPLTHHLTDQGEAISSLRRARSGELIKSKRSELRVIEPKSESAW